MNSRKILVIEDDPQGLASVCKILQHAGHVVSTASNGRIALDLIRSESFDLILSDVRMPEMTGLEFVKALALIADQTPVILMTAFGKVEDAVWAMKQGVVDFLTKPFKRTELLDSIEMAAKRSNRATHHSTGATSLGSNDGPRWLSAVMQDLDLKIATVARTSASVLLMGESGSGKERVARRIHELSSRSKTGKWVALNCAALPENLIESELFGYEKGAFTGATQSKVGLFELADGGTLLLDEIGDMPLSLQSRLLRVLQEGEVRRVGGTVSKKIDVRVIAATHRDLKEEALKGTFRQDLLFRLEVIQLKLPSLRSRKEDLELLVNEILDVFAKKHEKPGLRLAQGVIDRLRAYPWPGNIRELSNVLERATVFCSDGQIRLEDLPDHLLRLELAPSPESGVLEVRVGTPLKDIEDLMIRKTLEATQGDKNLTARLLGINSRTIYRKLEKS
ncbi:MAG: sigma-54-dependent Fis family transcriptional regulator [Bdellovibrionales bacterium]|nr:sigma-54-dependent Fis family transcriptional regulator [Bdellovibrionales bacterium]